MAQKKMRHCIYHGNLVVEDKFSTSKNPHHNGYLPYCKDCCNDIYNDMLKKMKTAEGAMWMTCAEMGVPFVKDVYDRFVSEYNNKNWKYTFGGYYTKITTQKLVKDWTGFNDTDVDFNDIAGLNHAEQIRRADHDRLVLEWGVQTSADYDFLIHEFEKNTQDIEFETPQHESLYRDLCLDRLELRKIREGTSGEDQDKVYKRMLVVLGKLKLDDFASNKPKTATEVSFFEKMKFIEENNVRDVFKNPKQFDDLSERRRYYKDNVLRVMGNSLVGHRDFDINLEDMKRYDLNK